MEETTEGTTEETGNHDTKCSGDQIQISDLKQGKVDRPIFLNPQLGLWKITSRENAGHVGTTVEWTSPL